MPIKATVFSNTNELINEIAERKTEIQDWSSKNILSLHQVIHEAVGSNTYRGIEGYSPGPKQVFVGWASQKLSDHKLRATILSISSQTEFDNWLEEFAHDLMLHWPLTQRPRRGINYGQSRKLTNLLLKSFVQWNKITSSDRRKLIGYIHVPLDEYVLKGIKKCVSEFPNYPVTIPSSPTMSSVRNKYMYDNIQSILRDISTRTNLEPIHLDVFFWNLNHQDR